MVLTVDQIFILALILNMTKRVEAVRGMTKYYLETCSKISSF